MEEQELETALPQPPMASGVQFPSSLSCHMAGVPRNMSLNH